MRLIAVILLAPCLISSLFGKEAPCASYTVRPLLANKCKKKAVDIHPRTSENFSGKLPSNPWTPNCVNSQQNSRWGELYNVDPIAIPAHVVDPVATLKEVLRSAKVPNFDCDLCQLVEEQGNYLHYIYTVHIPSGWLKGVYIDDIDIYYDEAKGVFEIRSASRKGYRDATHLDYSQPGANKKRVEAIRQAWNDAVQAHN